MRAQHGVGHGVERNRQVQIGAVLAPQYRQALDPRSSAAPAPPRRCHPPTHRLSDRGRSQPQQLLSCQFIVRRPAADSRRHRQLNDVELFDVVADPNEMTNLAAEGGRNRDLVATMNDKLNRLIDAEVGEDRGLHC